MIPGDGQKEQRLIRVPRIRGDDPVSRGDLVQVESVFPAYAGMIPISWTMTPDSLSVPRIRGDDPVSGIPTFAQQVCSPHTRG